MLGRYVDFFELFVDFRGYTNFFLLQDLVMDDHTAVRFFTPLCGFHRFSSAGEPRGLPALPRPLHRVHQRAKRPNAGVLRLMRPAALYLLEVEDALAFSSDHRRADASGASCRSRSSPTRVRAEPGPVRATGAACRDRSPYVCDCLRPAAADDTAQPEAATAEHRAGRGVLLKRQRVNSRAGLPTTPEVTEPVGRSIASMRRRKVSRMSVSPATAS